MERTFIARVAPISRRLACLSIASVFIAAAPAQQLQTNEGTVVSSPRPMVTRYCIGCHNDKLKTAGLTLTKASAEDVEQNPDVWEKVLRKIRPRYMPPAGLPRPDGHSYDVVVSSLETSLDAVAAAKPNPGRNDTFHRLNRTEYQHAIRDLLALDVDVASLLPSDDSSYGFDNITAGDLSPTLMERYLTAARKISRLAVGSPIRSPGGDITVLPSDLTQEEHFDELPFGTRGGAVIRYTFPLDAEYRIQLRLTRDRNEQVEGLSEPHQVEMTLDGERIQLFTVTPPPSGESHDLVDKDLYVRIPIKAGPHEVGATFLKKPSALSETKRQPYEAHFNLDRHPRIQPALYSVNIIGPYDASGAGDTPSRRRIFVCNPKGASEEEPCAKRILSILARHAYRRPVSDVDLQAPMKFFGEARLQGGFESSSNTQSIQITQFTEIT